MKKYAHFLGLCGFIIICCSTSDSNIGSVNQEPEEEQKEEQEETWITLEVPADPGEGMVWEFQPDVSDNFEYDAPANNKGSEFLEKWDDWYHNAWTGPGLTTWSRGHSFVQGGELKIIAERYQTNRVHIGIIHSNKTVQYPLYIEIRAKTMNSVLANAAWLLSPDDTQEIDFLEGYGATYSESAQNDHSWYAQRMHMSHHVFIRQPFTDWQPSEFEDTSMPPTWITRDDGNGNINWKDDFHRYGVYWKDPWHLYYYIDGKLVTQKEGKDQIDPVFHTNAVNPGDMSHDTRTGLSKPMDIIINAEDQDWRSTPGSGLQSDTYTPTDNELSNRTNHTFRVDWIRVFKPVNK